MAAAVPQLSPTETSGTLSWENFEVAIDELSQYAESIGESWSKEVVQPIFPGGAYLSNTHYKEIHNSLLKCEYHIVYSISYSVPVMYFNFSFPTGKLLSIDELCALLGKSIYEVSQLEHPLLHRPFFCLHPCYSSELMKVMLGTTVNYSPVGYLVAWLSLVARVLDIPFLNANPILSKLNEEDSSSKPEALSSILLVSPEKLSEKLKSREDLEQLIESECNNEAFPAAAIGNDPRLKCLSGWINSYDYIINAVKHGQVTESMIPVAAAKHSHKLYVQVVETYARQLIAKQEKLKAVGYLLLIGQNEEAINIIKAIMA